MAPSAAAQDATPWGQHGADGDNSRQGVERAPDDPGLRWHTDLADEGYSMGRTTYGFVGLEQAVLGPDDTIVTRAESEHEEEDTTRHLLGLDPETGDIAWDSEQAGLRLRCGQAVDGDGRLWAQRRADEGDDLFALDPATGEEIPDSVANIDQRCYRTTLHIGGDPEHLAVFDSGGFGVYDISGAAPQEQWTFENEAWSEDLLRWGVTGSGATRLGVFTDDSLIVGLIDTEREEALAEVVEFDLVSGEIIDRVDVEVMPDSSDEADHRDINSVQLARDGDTLVAATYVSAGAGFAGNGSVAAYDLATGIGDGPVWLHDADEPGEPRGLALGNGEAYTEHRTGALTAYDLATGEARVVTEEPSSENRSFLADDAGGVVTRVTRDDLDLEAESMVGFSATGTPRWAFDQAGLEEAAGLDEDEFDFSDALIGPMANDGAFLMGSGTELAMIDGSGGLDTLGPVGDRLAGEDRIGTSLELSRQFDRADTVVLARADEFPDALAGAPLAAHLEAPILLTPSDSLRTAVVAEIDRLGAEQAVLLGGEQALSAGVETALEAEGLVTQRYEGEHRWDTAAQIAADLPDPESAFVVRGIGDDPLSGWEDAVAVSALAARTGTPILLTATEVLPDDTADVLGEVDAATIVGGTAVVSDEVASEVAGQVDTMGARLAGANRFETSVEIADASVAAGMDPATTWVATGRNYPDSLAAAPVVGATAPTVAEGGVLLLVDGLDLDNSEASRDWLEANAGDIDRIRTVGGSAVVTDATLDQAAGAAGIE